MHLIFGAMVLRGTATEEDEKKVPTLDGIIFDEQIWEKTLVDIKGPEERVEDQAEIPAELRKKLESEGFSLGPGRSDGFEWLSSRKEGLCARPGSFEFLGKEAGEVVIRADDGTISSISVSLYNRGDNGNLPVSTFNTRIEEWKQGLDDHLKVESTERNSKGAVAVEGWMWRKGDTAALLESSINRSEKRPEFIRLRLASISAAKNQSTGVAKRRSLADNVVNDDKGNVMIDGVPMVDQGEKGYCVVASIERVGRYYGLEMDQHEMAQLADTTENGTNADVMEKAFQKITGRIHVRTLKLIEYDNRQFERDLKNYNREAKKADKWIYDIDLDAFYANPAYFWMKADPDTFRSVKQRQNRYDHFNRKIKEYVDQGIPLCWTLFLGMFKEGDLPQSFGGHMRLIIGYNFSDPDAPMIIYTDSWGEGHGRKEMRADAAYCMTTGLYAMVPNK
ncbi:cysteine peptidase family C39 domain-containing protein [Haloferula sp.]|uniref:cysteine peptidase family C39 domain-containing protein n=1 Tax=Haloferula sp. TaxID=2497595 RepID=UPI003C76BF53